MQLASNMLVAMPQFLPVRSRSSSSYSSIIFSSPLLLIVVLSSSQPCCSPSPRTAVVVKSTQQTREFGLSGTHTLNSSPHERPSPLSVNRPFTDSNEFETQQINSRRSPDLLTESIVLEEEEIRLAKEVLVE